MHVDVQVLKHAVFFHCHPNKDICLADAHVNGYIIHDGLRQSELVVAVVK